MREMIRMVVALSLICAFSGLVLSGLKVATRERIEEQILIYVKGPALNAALPEHDNDPVRDRRKLVLPDSSDMLLFPAVSAGRLTGLAFESFGPGYGGEIGIMVGFDPTADTISGIGVTTHKETPGIGSRITSPEFTTQFHRHPFSGLALKTTGGAIDAISGATVSSTGAAQAVQNAVRFYTANKNALLSLFPEN